ncbi:MAG: NAD-binding protein [Anaerolineales bacterium]|nr:NAD-binding protein [Anaerolineales bacterium]
MPDPQLVVKKNRRRNLKAQFRDARVLFQESQVSLLLFALLIFGGTLIFHFAYHDPASGETPSFSESLYVTFSMIFFQALLDFPSEWYLQILFFVIPIVGLTLVADGILKFGTALFNKQERGQKWQVSMASIYRDHIIVCGLGKVGYRVILELLRFGKDVVAVEIDEKGRFFDKVMALNVPVILGDATRSENLRKAGVQYADAILPATNDQMANLEIALDAREINPGIKVVMRMFDQEFARKVEKGFGIHTAFSTSALTAPIFAAAAMRLNIKHSFYVGDELMNLSELIISPESDLIGWSLNRLEREMDLTVLYFMDGEIRDIHPDKERVLDAGDDLLLLASIETLQKVRRLNQN